MDAEPQHTPTAPPDGRVRWSSRLLELQEIDLSIDRLAARLRGLEAQEDVRQARERRNAVETRVGELRLSLDEARRQQRRLEGDISSFDQKIAAERKRLYDGSVANPKELQSIEAEVANLQGRKGRLEDELIDAMERVEELEAHVPPVEAELAEALARVAEIEETTGRDLVETEQALAQRRQERDAVVPEVDPEVLQLYEDLRRQKKGVAAVELADGICAGCHQKLSAVYLDRLKRSDDVRRCEYCRRILVF